MQIFIRSDREWQQTCRCDEHLSKAGGKDIIPRKHWDPHMERILRGSRREVDRVRKLMDEKIAKVLE